MVYIIIWMTAVTMLSSTHTLHLNKWLYEGNIASSVGWQWDQLTKVAKILSKTICTVVGYVKNTWSCESHARICIRYMLSMWEVVNRTNGEALSSAYGHPIHGSVNRSGSNMQVVSCHWYSIVFVEQLNVFYIPVFFSLLSSSNLQVLHHGGNMSSTC